MGRFFKKIDFVHTEIILNHFQVQMNINKIVKNGCFFCLKMSTVFGRENRVRVQWFYCFRISRNCKKSRKCYKIQDNTFKEISSSIF